TGTYSDPLVWGKYVVLATRSHNRCAHLEALNNSTGALVWQHQVNAFQCTDPVYAGGLVMMSTRNPWAVEAWHLSTGDFAWRHGLTAVRWSVLTVNAPASTA